MSNNKFPASLKKAWLQYQDLYDTHMRLLKMIGDGKVQDVYILYESQIADAVKNWCSPEERFDTGDLDLLLEGGEND